MARKPNSQKVTGMAVASATSDSLAKLKCQPRCKESGWVCVGTMAKLETALVMAITGYEIDFLPVGRKVVVW